MEKYSQLLDITKNGLKTLLHLLDKAEAYIKENGVAEDTLLSAKLAPDMFDFTRQIQIASDDARRSLRLLAGKEHIRMEDTEKTIAELRERIAKTQDIVNELTLSDFEGADARHISLYWMGENFVEGKDLVAQLAIPNFLFHVTTAYAILRKEGVVIGKTDFITTLNMQPKVG
ncbi:MAG: DUF1993 domain-containing protein [Minisyncoccia bacterium]